GIPESSPRDRRPDRDEVIAGILPHQGLEGRQRQHIERDVFPPAYRLEGLRQARRESEEPRGPVESLHLRPGKISGQRNARVAIRPLSFPIGELSFQGFSPQRLTLPSRKIAVTYREGL